MQPRVSILLPAYDAEATLGACLRSIVRQREASWECVLIDDGSRDHTRQIARAFAERDARLVAPPPELCTDNAAMIAWAGIERLRLGMISPMDFAPRPRWPLDEA